MKQSLRHYCRNRRCRMKLQAPVENEHRAFCCRGCFESFYRSRCLVCEEPMRRKTEQQRFKSGHAVCRAQYRRFPHVYAWQLLPHRSRTQDARSAHFSASKMAVRDTRGICAPARVIAAELFPGPSREVVSSDGVVCQVYSRQRTAALPAPSGSSTRNMRWRRAS
jgi:hypothetical protein